MVVDILERMSGLSEAEILGGRSEMCADYRSILVELLSRRYANNEIVRLTGITRQSVSRISSAHADRAKHKYSLRCAMYDAEREVAAIAE